MHMVLFRTRANSRMTTSHNEPVMCCGYSEEFRQVVSCSEGSVSEEFSFATMITIYNRNMRFVPALQYKAKMLLISGCESLGL